MACNQNPTYNQKNPGNKNPSSNRQDDTEKKKKTMSLWINAYLRAIEERDSKEKANESLFDTCVFMNQKKLWGEFFFSFLVNKLYIDEIKTLRYAAGRPGGRSCFFSSTSTRVNANALSPHRIIFRREEDQSRAKVKRGPPFKGRDERKPRCLSQGSRRLGGSPAQQRGDAGAATKSE